jgi:lyso-ornithine lipid O-acyltransferase
MKSANSLKNSIRVFTDTLHYIKLSKRPDQNMRDLKAQWAQTILDRMKVELKVIGEVSSENSLLFIGNHISYLDIPLLMSSIPDLSFVAKKEIGSWPVFGSAAKKIDTVFVQREKAESRKQARLGLSSALREGKRVVVFPSGTTCMTESKMWKKGAFEIAHDLNIWVQPFRISYKPLRSVAYIDDDFFPVHLFKLSGFEKIQAEVEFQQPIKITNPTYDCLFWNYWARGIPVA